MYDPHRSGVRRRVTGGVDNPAMRYDGTTGHVEAVNGTAYEPGTNRAMICRPGTRKRVVVLLFLYKLPTKRTGYLPVSNFSWFVMQPYYVNSSSVV